MAKDKSLEPEFGTPDDENPEWTEEDFARARPFAEVMAEHGISLKSLRGPHSVTVTTSVDIPVDIVNHFKAGGNDWELRIRQVLKEHIDRSGARKRSA